MGAKDLMRRSHMSVNRPVKPAELIEKEEETPVIKSKTVVVEKNESALPTPIKQVKRPDVSADEYGVKPDITNFQLYNYELSEFLSNFSKMNKKHGGNPITKSQFMETILGFVYYDMGIKPEGFENTQELLKYLQNQFKK